ncbi:hypothetical protein KCP75_01615 [Salmonella enterica subsp. enterica]|nr:hypothetical protein KCP75_01615 [Salmonella enterica subsp. enterica]
MSVSRKHDDFHSPGNRGGLIREGYDAVTVTAATATLAVAADANNIHAARSRLLNKTTYLQRDGGDGDDGGRNRSVLSDALSGFTAMSAWWPGSHCGTGRRNGHADTLTIRCILLRQSRLTPDAGSRFYAASSPLDVTVLLPSKPSQPRRHQPSH